MTTEPNTITFHKINADWVMRINADRRIEVNEDVEVTEAAKKVLEAMQYLLTQKREWVGLTDEDFKPMVQKAMVYYGYKPEHSTLTSGSGFYVLVRAIEAKLKEKNT